MPRGPGRKGARAAKGHSVTTAPPFTCSAAGEPLTFLSFLCQPGLGTVLRRPTLPASRPPVAPHCRLRAWGLAAEPLGNYFAAEVSSAGLGDEVCVLRSPLAHPLVCSFPTFCFLGCSLKCCSHDFLTQTELLL